MASVRLPSAQGPGVAWDGLHAPQACVASWGALVYVPDPVNGGVRGEHVHLGSGWLVTRGKASRERLGVWRRRSVPFSLLPETCVPRRAPSHSCTGRTFWNEGLVRGVTPPVSERSHGFREHSGTVAALSSWIPSASSDKQWRQRAQPLASLAHSRCLVSIARKPEGGRYFWSENADKESFIFHSYIYPSISL